MNSQFWQTAKRTFAENTAHINLNWQHLLVFEWP